MNSGDPEATDAEPPPEVFDQLAVADPAGRTRIVRELIAGHPRGRLVLPARGGLRAVLDGIDLSPVTDRGDPGGVAVLRRADLRGADLRGASLRKADLREALMGGANFRGANLEGANLGGSDLAGACFAGAALSEATLDLAMLEEADLRGATLRFAKLRGTVLEHARLQRSDLWGANLEGVVSTYADLEDARLDEADLRGGDLTGANLRSAVLKRTNLRDCQLRGADFRDAALSGVDLKGASLRDARLQDVDLSDCDITHAHLCNTRLDGARFRVEQLGGVIGEEIAGRFGEARQGYLTLERAFEGLGDHDAASWAYRRRRRMQKHEALEKARSDQTHRRWRAAGRHLAQYATDQSVEWLCDYGESIPRVLASLAVLYLFFTAVYGLTGSVARENLTPSGPAEAPTRRPLDLAIFSLLAMTGNHGDRLVPAHDLALTLVGVHVFAAITLTGLLGFVVGNRIRR